jgi:GH35 family endo-1,4-beta-xylanase
MYEDAFNACYYDNPDVCTAFVSWGFTDNYSWKKEQIPLYFTEDYEMKSSYTAVLKAI